MILLISKRLKVSFKSYINLFFASPTAHRVFMHVLMQTVGQALSSTCVKLLLLKITCKAQYSLREINLSKDLPDLKKK